MLRKETVEEGTLDLIKKLMVDDVFRDFNLVGGTALSLMIGHRKSIDIDLFTNKDFSSHEIAEYLANRYNAENIQSIKNGVFCFINNIKVDIIAHQYPLVEKLEIIENIRMVSLLDIGAMKLNAIYDNGTRLKDFVDIFALLQYFSLDQLLSALGKKYPEIDVSMVGKSLLYHEDIQMKEPIYYIGPEIKWPQIAERLRSALHTPSLIFSNHSDLTLKLLGKSAKHKISKRKRF
ncbi:nucleotidyl transferase AbiEii/AbiGii toxin family protein [Pseudoflavitalea rhizosphaerae]|uniref:nucleotidyl transferase AbiEii/AbiGii toxin family protein n=1 Tax=Pseudoflavitalea rhizosphaerae TaxID=1884793 RepID=UPI000F8D1EA6|nr:nucleotidyl transferase AbiEii/AbiGii toxin family protein [Pseudoflavitalea rhizosphaerae]